jgi:hypothetical protein
VGETLVLRMGEARTQDEREAEEHAESDRHWGDLGTSGWRKFALCDDREVRYRRISRSGHCAGRRARLNREWISGR